MTNIKFKEIGSTGVYITRDGLTVYYEKLNEWYEFPTEAPSDYDKGYFYLPHSVRIDGYRIRGVHHAVAMAWEPESFKGKTKPNVHHCDFNRFNNDLDNLIVLDKASHTALHNLIGDEPVSKDEAKDFLDRWEAIPWGELFKMYKSGELKNYDECRKYIKDEFGIEISRRAVHGKFKELNDGLNPSGRTYKTYKTRESIALDDPVLIEAFQKYESGELKNHQECADFIKDRTGKEITGRTVGNKFKQLRELQA